LFATLGRAEPAESFITLRIAHRCLSQPVFVSINGPHFIEVKALMARRDRIVEQFQKLIAEKGENEVLY